MTKFAAKKMIITTAITRSWLIWFISKKSAQVTTRAVFNLKKFKEQDVKEITKKKEDYWLGDISKKPRQLSHEELKNFLRHCAVNGLRPLAGLLFETDSQTSSEALKIMRDTNKVPSSEKPLHLGPFVEEGVQLDGVMIWGDQEQKQETTLGKLGLYSLHEAVVQSRARQSVKTAA